MAGLGVQGTRPIARGPAAVAGCGMITRRTMMASALPALAATPILATRPAFGQAQFDTFLAGVRADALASGVTPATVDRAFAGLRRNPKVLELDSYAPEKTQSWERYRASRISDQRVATGRRHMQANGPVLAEVERRWGVDPAVIVAIWGLESAFGGYTGGFAVIEALATLAADGRKDGFFRRELISALRILDNGDVTLARMTGSYAGAMGQPQFMPSSFLTYAIDFDGKGRRDIWDDRNDVLASIANYLAAFGWQRGEPWGQRIRVPAGFGAARDDRRPLAEWARQGVTRPDGTPFSRPEAIGAVVMPDGPGGEVFMAYANFGPILRYNNSDLYGLSVGVLANRISDQGSAGAAND